MNMNEDVISGIDEVCETFSLPDELRETFKKSVSEKRSDISALAFILGDTALVVSFDEMEILSPDAYKNYAKTLRQIPYTTQYLKDTFPQSHPSAKEVHLHLMCIVMTSIRNDLMAVGPTERPSVLMTCITGLRFCATMYDNVAAVVLGDNLDPTDPSPYAIKLISRDLDVDAHYRYLPD
jgi:hypothetical protein